MRGEHDEHHYFSRALFYSDDLERANIYEASNADGLIEQLQPVQPPIWRVRELRHVGRYNSSIDALTKNYADELQIRSDALTGNSASINGVLEFTDAQLLEHMQAKGPLLDELARKLRERIGVLMCEQGGGS